MERFTKTGGHGRSPGSPHPERNSIPLIKVHFTSFLEVSIHTDGVGEFLQSATRP